MIYCWKCGKSTGLVGRPARTDDCPHCRAELRTCRGCRFYDVTKSGGCSESRAEPPAEKDKVNFCDYFVGREDDPPPAPTTVRFGGANVESARAALDKLFKK